MPGRAQDLTAQRIDDAIPDRDDPLRAIIEHGQNVPLGQYLRATDATVWVHLDRWRDSGDHTLQYLAKQLARRSFPRAMNYPGTIKQGEKLKAEAIRLAREAIPAVEPEYLVAIDEPGRVSYKRYTPGEGPNQSIQTVDRDGRLRAIETDERSIVSKVAKKFYMRRLFIPEKIRDALKKFAETERIYS